MGQYYKAVIERGKQIKVYEPTWWKLGEQGANEEQNNWIMYQLYHKPALFTYVGDYTDKDTHKVGDYLLKIAWESNKCTKFTEVRFDLDDKFVVNYTKMQYIDLSKYKDDEWIPYVVLTASSNGMGGGDYYGLHEELAGTWARDYISVEDNSFNVENFTEFTVHFDESEF